jgi:uncharacterized phiE125 gp8 family phage protein
MPIPDATFTLAAAKAHLRILHDDEDALIESMLAAAVERCEEWCGRAFSERTVRMVFSDATIANREAYRLPIVPLATMTSFKYSNGTPTPVDVPASTYRVRSNMGGVQWLALDALPGDLVANGDCMTFEYSAAPVGDVPKAVVQAAMLYLGDLYENREANIVGTITSKNEAAIALLAPHRVNAGM